MRQLTAPGGAIPAARFWTRSLSEYRGAPRLPRGAPSVGGRGAPRLRRGATSVGDRGAPRLRRGATSVGDRGAPRLRRGATSVGGYGGPFRGPPFKQTGTRGAATRRRRGWPSSPRSGSGPSR